MIRGVCKLASDRDRARSPLAPGIAGEGGSDSQKPQYSARIRPPSPHKDGGEEPYGRAGVPETVSRRVLPQGCDSS